MSVPSSILLNVDSYKASHFCQYPPDTRYLSSYIEARNGKYSELVFFGLQGFLKKTLTIPFTESDVEEAKALLSLHGVPFNEAGWRYILEKYDGYLPLKIEALPEGVTVPLKQTLVQVTNTDPECAWLTTYIETALLRAVWYPATVATLSSYCKGILYKYLDMTADSTEGLEFKLHDFGARGASSEETAGIGGLAHLVNFKGSDTLSALVAAKEYYSEPCAAFSIPAAEHSTITSWGEASEAAAFEHMLNQFLAPGATLAVVSDSYNLWRAIDEHWGLRFKERILNSGGTLVVRPDSGNPIEVVPECLERLMQCFGYRVNRKGYRVLPDAVRVIQGDAVSVESIERILAKLQSKGISTDNLSFGMGAELLQKVNRDTLGFAMKASAIKGSQDHWIGICKKPATDPLKASRPGRQAVIYNADNRLISIPEAELGANENQLRVVYENGRLLIDETLETIRQRAAVGFCPD